MENQNNKSLVNSAAAFIIIALLVLLVYYASHILFPLLLAALFAILLRPVAKFLQLKLRFPFLLSIGVAVLLGVALATGIVVFMSVQLSDFMNDLPTIKKNLLQNVAYVQQWIDHSFGLNEAAQNEYLNGAVSSSSSVVSLSSFSSITNSLLYLILIPIYTFLILNYRTLLLGFLMRLVPKKNIENLKVILVEIKSVVGSYIVGLLIELVIVATLTSFGLWLVGVKYFIFLGIMTAILNLIPYVGIMVAFVISSFIALSGTTEPTIIIGVLGVNVVVQFIDNNILIPKVVGSKVSINALASMVGVIIGGSLAGISGMFLAIPIIAMMKVVLDRVPTLEPYGYLLGDKLPKTFDWNNLKISRLIKRKIKSNIENFNRYICTNLRTFNVFINEMLFHFFNAAIKLFYLWSR